MAVILLRSERPLNQKKSCVWPLWCEHATLCSWPSVLSCHVFQAPSLVFAFSSVSSLPPVSPVLFPQFLSWSCVLWLLHPCTSLRTQEGHFPLWRCVNADCRRWSSYALPSLHRGVTGGLFGLIPCSRSCSLSWIMASGPLYRLSFVFWNLNKYLSWTCDWIRVFPWQI